MSKNRWLSLAILGQLLFFAITAAPHTVHHGLHDANAEDCPVSAITTQTNGDLPNILPLPTSLPLIDSLDSFDLTLTEKPTSQVYRSRAPPHSFPA